jgi:hypothetical protein
MGTITTHEHNCRSLCAGEANLIILAELQSQSGSSGRRLKLYGWRARSRLKICASSFASPYLQLVCDHDHSIQTHVVQSSRRILIRFSWSSAPASF